MPPEFVTLVSILRQLAVLIAAGAILAVCLGLLLDGSIGRLLAVMVALVFFVCAHIAVCISLERLGLALFGSSLTQAGLNAMKGRGQKPLS